MNLPQKQIESKGDKILWILGYLFILVGLFFSFINFEEFYKVRFKGQESAYPFGNINENQWYYQSASLYVKYCLVCGMLFSAATIITFWATIKKNKRLLTIGVCLTFLFLIANIISSAR